MAQVSLHRGQRHPARAPIPTGSRGRGQCHDARAGHTRHPVSWCGGRYWCRGMRRSVYQVGHELMRDVLRDGLLVAVASEHGSGLGSVQCRASAALYVLLGDHPVDRHGRCRSCRRPGAVIGGRHRICRVFLAARCYLYQSEEMLLRHLAGELYQYAMWPCGAGGPPDPDSTALPLPPDPDDTNMLEPVGECLRRPVDLLRGVGREGHRPSVVGMGCRWCDVPADAS